MLKRSIFILCNSLLGLVFLYSGYAKLFPVEYFEFSFVELGVGSWLTAPIEARLMIGLEFLTCIMLLYNIFANDKRIIRFAIYFLLFFTFYLVFIWIKEGNSSNCGCFGTALPMTPAQSIGKNIGMLAMTFVLLADDYKAIFRASKWLVFVAVIFALAMPFILNPVSVQSDVNSDISSSQRLDLSSLYAKDYPNPPEINLMQGKRIIAFLSLTCSHCRIGARKLNIIHSQYPNIPIFYILNGDEKKLQEFLNDTKTTDIPYRFMSLKQGFLKNAGNQFPAIMWVNNGQVIHQKTYLELHASELYQWYKNK